MSRDRDPKGRLVTAFHGSDRSISLFAEDQTSSACALRVTLQAGAFLALLVLPIVLIAQERTAEVSAAVAALVVTVPGIYLDFRWTRAV